VPYRRYEVCEHKTAIGSVVGVPFEPTLRALVPVTRKNGYACAEDTINIIIFAFIPMNSMKHDAKYLVSKPRISMFSTPFHPFGFPSTLKPSKPNPPMTEAPSAT